MRKLLNKKALSAFLAIVMTFATMAGMFTFSASAATTDPDTSWFTGTDGVTTGQTEWEIDTPAELLGFVTLLSGGKTFAGHTIVLTSDIDLNPEWDASTKTAPDNVWPLINLVSFNGTFDGNGHTIRGIYYNITQDNMALFGRSDTMNSTDGVSYTDDDVCIQNLSIKNSYVKLKNNRTAGLVAPRYDNGGVKVTISNVDNGMIVDAADVNTADCGAFVGYPRTSAKINITNSVFSGTIYGMASAFIGGNGTGASENITLTNCGSYGDVASTSKYFTMKNEVTCTNCTYVKDTDVTSLETNASGSIYEVTEEMTGTAAQAILNEKGMTGWVATTTGYPMPKTLVKASTPTPDADALTNYVGYQTTKVADGTFGLRLVGNLDADATLADYDSVGFKVVAFFGDKAVAQECDITTVYETITASYDGTKSYSEAGKFVFVQECANLPATLGDITFEVTTYATAAGGETVTLGATYRFVVDVNEIPSAS